MPIPRESQWACQAEFSAALKLATVEQRKRSGQPYAELQCMAELELRTAAGLWRTLADLGFSRPGCYVRQNILQTSSSL